MSAGELGEDAERRARTARTRSGRRQAPRAGRDPARRARLRDDDPELLLEPDLALRPDPRAEPGRHDDRPVRREHRRQGRLQGPLLLRPRARPGAVRAALLRRAQRRRRRIVDGRARGAAESPGRRDDLPDRPVGQRAARAAAAAARVARGRALRARLRRRDGGRARPRHDGAAALARCCSATCSPRSSASPPSG